MRYNSNLHMMSDPRNKGQWEPITCQNCGHEFEQRWESIHVGASGPDDCDEIEIHPFPDTCPHCNNTPGKKHVDEIQLEDPRDAKYDEAIDRAVWNQFFDIKSEK